jgi:hypothetical protein
MLFCICIRINAAYRIVPQKQLYFYAIHALKAQIWQETAIVPQKKHPVHAGRL